LLLYLEFQLGVGVEENMFLICKTRICGELGAASSPEVT
jgi:hypothetical protein